MSRLVPVVVILNFALAAAGPSCGNQESVKVAESSPAAGVTYAGGDGTSPQSANVIQNAFDERTGIRAETAWILQHYPGSAKTAQALLSQEKQVFDVIDVTTADGRKLKVYFDITAFFGKF